MEAFRCYYQLAEYEQAETKLGRLHAAEIAVRRAIESKSRDEFRDFNLALGMVLAAKRALDAFEREVHENPGPQDALDQIRQLRAR